MGKVELKFEADAPPVGDADRRQPLPSPREQATGDAARWPRASDPATAERLALEWNETNREALDEHKRLIAQRGSFADSARRW